MEKETWDFPRILLTHIWPWIGENKVIIIKGARQVGKTTLLKFMQNKLEKQGEHTVYFAVDQENGTELFSAPKLFIQFLRDQYGLQPGKKLYVFLDEVQTLPKAGVFLKATHDAIRDEVQLIVSGSSTLELTQNAEFLTGRKVEFILRHFSFREYLYLREQKQYAFAQAQQGTLMPLKSNLQNLKNFWRLYHQDLEYHALDFLTWGGYPEIISRYGDETKRLIVLKEIIQTYIDKDIIQLLRVEQASKFRDLIQLLSSQIGNLVNRNEIKNTLDLHHNTISKYLDILQGTFMFQLIRPYTTNPRKEVSKMPKVYAEDLGVVSLMTGRTKPAAFSHIDGAIMENFVFNELVKSGGDTQIRFHRTLSKAEVDFVIDTKKTLIPIEVKFRNKQQGIPRALGNFMDANGSKIEHAFVITQNELRYQDGVMFLPAVMVPFIPWKIFLGQSTIKKN